MRIHRLHCLVTFALAVALGPSVRPLFAQNLAAELDKVAEEIKITLDQEQLSTVRVGEFTGRDSKTQGMGGKIQTTLIDLIKKKKLKKGQAIKIDNDESFFTVDGSFKAEPGVDKKNKPDDTLVIRIDVTIWVGKKKVDTTYHVGYRDGGNEDLQDLVNVPISQEKNFNANPDDYNKYIKEQIQNPQSYIDGSRVSLRKDSRFAVEVLAGPAGEGMKRTARGAFLKTKLPHVKLALGEEYILRIHNLHKEQELAVRVSIDGVDMFQFFQGKTRPRVLLIPPGKYQDIKGWRIDLNTVKAFLVGKITDSAAFKDASVKDKLQEYKSLGNPNIGLIFVTFHRSWEKGKKPEGARSAGTDLGRKIHSPAKRVQRDIGQAVGKIVIRYEKK